MDTVFVNGVTLSDEDWFNDLNRLHYTIFSDPANLAAVKATLHAAPGAIGGTTPAAGSFTTVTCADNFGVAATKKLYLDGVALTGNTYIVESSADTVDHYAGNVLAIRFTTASVIIGQAATVNLSVSGTTTTTGALIMATTATPTGAGTGVTGQFAWDTSYLYVCTATNDWRRVALTDF